MNNINNCQIKSRAGSNNPMWGRKHSDEAKRKQSEAAKKRYQEYQKWQNANKPMTMDEFLSSPTIKENIEQIINDLIRKYK